MSLPDSAPAAESGMSQAVNYHFTFISLTCDVRCHIKANDIKNLNDICNRGAFAVLLA